MSLTPTTRDGLRQYDGLEPAVAVAKAWSQAGSNPAHHYDMQARVRSEMPLLARALDRLAYGDQMKRLWI